MDCHQASGKSRQNLYQSAGVRSPALAGSGRADEELDFHLLELAGAEGVVAGGDFVAEGLALLGDAEGDLDAGGVDDVAEVGEDALGGFGAEVDLAGFVLHGAGVGFEHQVELAGLGERAGFVGVWADDHLLLVRSPWR